MIYFIAFVIVYFLHVLLKLNWYATGVLMVFAILIIPLHKKRYNAAKKNQQKFYEVSLYLDTILYSFVKEEKVESAIRDVSQTLPKGPMKTLVQQAWEYLEMTFDKVEVLEESLAMVEKEYGCKRIHDVHQFMVHVEYYGGEVEKPVSLLLSDKSRWEQRIKANMAHRKKKLVDVILSVATSLLICGAILYLPILDMDISGEPLVQICSLIVIGINDLIVLKAQKYLMVDWLNIQLTESDEYYEKKMEEFQNYDEVGEKRRSLILGCVGIFASIVCFIFAEEWVVVFMLLLTLFFFQQHQVGKGIMRKNLVAEIKYAFPNWLLDIVLLLQSENVYVALEKSKAHVPGVLRKELYLLMERLEMEPESSEPYHKFLQDFAIPEVDSAMGILYSLSIGNSTNANKQISELVEKNLELLDITETELLESSTSGMYALFLLPVVVASFKLVVDMVFLMLQFIQVPVI